MSDLKATLDWLRYASVHGEGALFCQKSAEALDHYILILESIVGFDNEIVKYAHGEIVKDANGSFVRSQRH